MPQARQVFATLYGVVLFVGTIGGLVLLLLPRGWLVVLPVALGGTLLICLLLAVFHAGFIEPIHSFLRRRKRRGG